MYCNLFLFQFGTEKKTSLEKIEEGLAQARALIQEAIRSKNYVSAKKEDFVPKGSIYWNPHAFHQLSLKVSEATLSCFCNST